MTIPLFLGEVLLALVGTGMSLYRLGAPAKHPDPPVAWLLWSWSVVVALLGAAFGLVALGVPVPAWVFLCVFAGLDVVVLWQSWMMLRPRRQRG